MIGAQRASKKNRRTLPARAAAEAMPSHLPDAVAGERKSTATQEAASMRNGHSRIVLLSKSFICFAFKGDFFDFREGFDCQTVYVGGWVNA